jgi:1-acyl-sn-glycerol-3-phosphate acyltransferase
MSVFFEKMMFGVSRPVIGTYAGTMLKMNVVKHEPFPDGAKIIAPNHPSTTDPFFIAAMVRKQSFILIKDFLFQVPIMGEYLRRSGHIPVCAGKGAEAIDAALDHLKQGHTIMIFPEGCLSPEKGFAKARTGVARLALLSGAPVYPVGIGLQWERLRTIRSEVHGQVEHGRWYLRGPYNVTVGQPLFFKGDVEDRDHVVAVAENVMHHIIELTRESENRFTPAHGFWQSVFETL